MSIDESKMPTAADTAELRTEQEIIGEPKEKNVLDMEAVEVARKQLAQEVAEQTVLDQVAATRLVAQIKNGEIGVEGNLAEQIPEESAENQLNHKVIEDIRIAPLVQERINSEEKFKTYKTDELISALSRGIEKLRLTEQEAGKISQAVNLAVELHIDQKDRPSGEPYINHILNVAKRLVVEYGVTNPNIIMAAALHDSVEDQSSKLAGLNSGAEGDEREKALGYITTHFGERVSAIVHSLSNEEVPDGLDTKTKNRMYAEHVTEAVKDPEVALVKLADFSDNALTLEKVTDPGRRAKLTEKYMPVVAMFIDRVQDEDIQMNREQKNNLVAKLKSAYSEMEVYLRNKV